MKLSKLKKKINTFIKLSPEITDENLEYICNLAMNENLFRYSPYKHNG